MCRRKDNPASEAEIEALRGRVALLEEAVDILLVTVQELVRPDLETGTQLYQLNPLADAAYGRLLLRDFDETLREALR